MKKGTVTIYKCEHCKKYSISASSISRHEKYCRKKPENMHKCFQYCKYLERDRAYDRDTDSVRTIFTCLQTGNKMYSYLAEKKKTSYSGNPIELTGERMPLDCNLYKIMEQTD